MSEITARPNYIPNALILEFNPQREQVIAEAVDGKSGSVVLASGSPEIDSLNAELGLFAVRYFSDLGLFVFYFKQLLNMPMVLARYQQIDNVVIAEPDSYLHVPESTDIEVFRTDGAWHFIFWDSFGLTASDSTAQHVSYFRVRDGMVDQYQSDCDGVPENIPCPSTRLQE